MNADWPKTLRIGGQEYEIYPEMPMMEMISATEAFKEESRKLILLQMSMGMNIEQETIEALGLDSEFDNA